MTSSRAVFLTGFMGAGKTSVGAALAQRLRWPFHDLDAAIVERAGRSVAEIFQSSGEAEFRRLESEALAALLGGLHEPAVVALGGGTLEQAQNMAAVRRAGGVLVALDAPPETLFARARREGTRPLAREEEAFRELYARRRATYQKADVIVDSGADDLQAVVERVQTSVEAVIGPRRHT